MTEVEIKRRDIIKLVYKNGDSSYALVDDISDTNIHIREPPDKDIVLDIQDGEIDDILSIELVYSAPVTGIAVARNFVEGQSIVLVYASSPEDEKVGVITRLEEDMIDVNVDGEMIYIDFGYVGVPPEFQSITIHDGFIFEMEDDYYLPESQHRYTLERQLSDLMDKLLAVPKQTSRTIRNSNRVVQRFRELRQLFSNDQMEPQREPHSVTPYNVKWVLPVLDLLERGRIRRALYPTEEDSLQAFHTMSQIQLGQNSSTGRSFRSIYTKLLNEISPFISDLNGSKIESNVEVLLPKPTIIKTIAPKILQEKKVAFLSQVLVKPYADPYGLVHTTPEVAHFASYYTLPVDYTRAFVPGNTLLSRTHYAQLAPYTHRVPTGESKKTLSEIVPDIDTLNPFYSVQGCVKQLSPYLVVQNNLTFLYEHILIKLNDFIQDYQVKVVLPEYVANPLIEYEQQSASEYQVSLLHTDNGSLHAIKQCKQMILDYTSRLDKHIEKRLDTSNIAPPVVKEYTTLKQLSADNGKDIFYDPEFDKTDYDVYKGMNVEEIMEQLVRVEYMPPSEAYLNAPYLLKKKRPVLNGEYAQLATPNRIVYYKRTNQSWKLDETCSGPYPCASNEPECTTDCVDISFRLKENLVHSILVDYQLDMYKSKASFDKFIQDREQQLEFLLHAKKHLLEQSELKYNNRMNSMGKSIVIIHQSPKVSLFNLILEKPFEERYTELLYFIRDYTRVAHPTEDEHWLYCVSTGLKLVPKVFQNLIKAYEQEQYDDVLERLLTEGSLVKEDGMIVTKAGGIIIGTIALEHTFDEMVHSNEFEDDPIYKLKREDNPLTPFLVELLNLTSITIGVNVTSYYNFIIHKVLSVPSNYLIHVIALVLRFAEIEHSISVEDTLVKLMKKEQAYQSIFTKFKQPMEEFSDVLIMKEIKKVSNYYEVKQLLQRKPNTKMGLQKTSSTLWETFLPPSNIHVTGAKTEYNTAMKILELIQVQSHKKPLREGTYQMNTIPQPLVPEDAIRLMERWIPVHLSYIKSKLFIPAYIPLPYDNQIKQVVLRNHDNADTPLMEDTNPFDILIPHLLNDMKKHGYSPSLNMQEVPIVYLQSFVQNIGRLYPSFLLNKPEYYNWNSYPFRFEKILLHNHLEQLKEMSNRSIFGKLAKYSTQFIGLQGILDDTSIDEMIQQFSLTRTKTTRNQCIYYIYSILNNYITHCPIDHHRVLFGILDIYCEYFTLDVKKVFVTTEAINTYILKQKTNEANERQLLRDQLSADDKFLFDFRQSMNISKEAQILRTRDYNAEQHRLETELFGNDLFAVAEDNDQGGDGNGDGEND